MKQVKLTESAPRICWFREGAGEQPVLLIMGFGMRGEAWRPQVDGLKHRHPVVYYDARGLGDSDPVSGGLTIKEMAQDALRVMDEAGLRRAHLVGVSMGGMVAQELALMAPTRFWSLSLLATHSGGPLTWIPKPTSLKDLVLANFASPARRFERLERLLYPAEYRRTCDRAALERRMQACFGEPTPQVTLNAQLAAVMRHRTHRRLRALTLPTLVVRADKDRMIAPELVDRLMTVLPRARLVAFEDAGHGLIYQRAESLNRALLDHFEANAPHALMGAAG